MPLKTLRVLAFADVQRQAQQLVAAFDLLGVDDLGDAQVDLGEVVDADLGRPAPRRPAARAARLRPAARTARRAASGRHAASGACTRRCGGAPSARAASANPAARRAGRPRPVPPAPAAPASGRSSAARKASMQTLHTSCSAASCPACLASSQGLCWSTYSLTRSASSMISRSALPNSRSSYSSAHGAAVRAQAVEQRAAFDAEVGRQPAAEALG